MAPRTQKWDAVRAFWYPVALIVGLLLGFAFTEVLPMMIFGEGAVTTDLGIAFALAVAAILPAMFVGGVILRSWRGAAIGLSSLGQSRLRSSCWT